MTPNKTNPSDIREAIADTIKAWESLAGDKRYSYKDIEDWLKEQMQPAIDKLRAALSHKPAIVYDEEDVRRVTAAITFAHLEFDESVHQCKGSIYVAHAAIKALNEQG